MEEARFFANTNVVQKNQLSPLLVCTPSESVLERYHELEREADAEDEEHDRDRKQQTLGNLLVDVREAVRLVRDSAGTVRQAPF